MTASVMRVALFTGNYNYVREGANQALNRLVGHLEARGHEVRVYSPVTDTPAFPHIGTLIPVPSITLPVRNEFQLALGIPKYIRHDIERFAPDLIHVSTPDILGARAQTMAKAMGLPVVASLHTLFETYVEHYGLRWLRPAIEAHLRRFYRRSDYVLVPTPALRVSMHANGINRVGIWSRGIDRNRFNPARRDQTWRTAQGFAQDDIVILFFGRLVIEKGVDIFIATVKALEASRGKRVRALVVGSGPAEGRFAALPHAVLTGHLEGDDLARAVASADIFLTPSITESFGNVTLEAMAAGLAVVSADAPSSRSLIEHSSTGMLCAPTKVTAYVDAIGALIDAPDHRRRLGADAHKASAVYTWNAASSAVEAAYAEILSR